MAVEDLLLDFAVVLIAAEIGGSLFRRLRMPRAVGMLVAGIAIGPFTPGITVRDPGIQDLALLGAVFLMFSTGLSFDIRGFRKLGVKPFLLAASGVGASFAGGLGLGLAAGWALLPAIFVGLILTSTSTTIALKLLADSGLGGVAGADLVTAAVLIDDIMALSLMTVAVGIASPVPVPLPALIAGLAGIIGLAALLIFVSRHALPPILRATEAMSPSSTIMFAVSFGLLISFAFAVLGLPPLVGAFFAGSIIASTEYGPRVTRHIAPVTALFMGVFFASIGMLIDPGTLPGVLLISLAALGVAVGGKMVPAVLFLRKVGKVPSALALPLATVLLPRAEIGLIIAEYGVTINLTTDLLGIAMAVMIGTALLPGPLLELANRMGGPASERTPAESSR